MLLKVLSLITLTVFSFVVSAKNADSTIILPTQYGANGRDTKDDSSAFQKCINDAKKKGISKIVIPPGLYVFEKEIKIEGVSNLIIEGSSATLVKPSGHGSNIFYGNYNQGITIRDLNFEGNRSNDFEGQWPHEMNACAILGKSSGIRFENCIVKDFYYGVCLGTSTENGYDVWIQNCQFFNCNSDIDLYGKPSVHIMDNSSHNCTGHSIQIEPAYRRVDGCYDYTQQPQIEALSVGNIISGNVIEGCKGIGIVVFGGSENIHVINNQIINYGYSGILIKEESANVSVQGNIISNSMRTIVNERPWTDKGAGVVVLKAKNAVISNNIICHANTGVFLFGTDGSIVANNMVSDSKDAGICLYDTNKILAYGNYVDNYNLNGSWWGNSGLVVCNSRDIRISNSTICDTLSNAHAIFSSESERIEVKDVVGYGYKTSLTYPATLSK